MEIPVNDLDAHEMMRAMVAEQLPILDSNPDEQSEETSYRWASIQIDINRYQDKHGLINQLLWRYCELITEVAKFSGMTPAEAFQKMVLTADIQNGSL